MMEFAIDLLASIAIVAVVFACVSFFSFFIDVPKQLKRIADALEKEGADNGQ